MIRLNHRFANHSRREWLRAGGLSCLGLSSFHIQHSQAKPFQSRKHAKNCIVLFLTGGPPQHSTWDPKPNAPAEVRGEFGPISTNVTGIQICSLFPQVAKIANHFCFLRAVSTDDNAHSSSGYAMLTGVPHAPLNAENVNPGAPNDWPTLGSLVRQIKGESGGLPSSVRLPMHIFNTDRSVWPGQDAGFLGRSVDPWLFRCEPNSPDFQIPELTLNDDISPTRFTERRDLLKLLDKNVEQLQTIVHSQNIQPAQRIAFDLLTSAKARSAFDLTREKSDMRDRYGRNHFGQSCLLARRLIEADVSYVHVNWYRSPDEPADAPCWDSHVKENSRLKKDLAPTADQAISALVEDLNQRGMLEETLVVCMSEFGRTPKLNAAAGRDHWGHVFSIAMAGGGIQGGMTYGVSDKNGAYPLDGRVLPRDLTATILHCLGMDPHSEIRDSQNRPFFASKGDVIEKILA